MKRPIFISVSPLEDPDNVDKRRAEVGLGPLADYVSNWNIKSGMLSSIRKKSAGVGKEIGAITNLAITNYGVNYEFQITFFHYEGSNYEFLAPSPNPYSIEISLKMYKEIIGLFKIRAW